LSRRKRIWVNPQPSTKRRRNSAWLATLQCNKNCFYTKFAIIQLDA
jgi:hypothetical protein